MTDDRSARLPAMHVTVRIALIGLAVAGATVVLLSTRRAVGTSPDSWTYLGTAQNLRHGLGLTLPFTTPTSPLAPGHGISRYGRVPLTDFPPLYPLVLATLGKFGGGVVGAARMLNALLFGVALWVVGTVSWRASRSSAIAIAVPVAVAIGPSLRVVYVFKWSWLVLSSFVLSEMLAATLSYVFVGVVATALVEPRRSRWTVAVVAAVLAVATRWSALAVIAAGAVAVVLWPGRRALRQRFGVAAALVVPPVVLTAAWNRWSGGRAGASARHLAFRPPGAAAWTTVRHVIASWFVPSGAASWVQLVVVVVVAALSTVSLLAARRDGAPLAYATQLVLALMVPAVVVVNVLAQATVDASVPIDARVLGLAQPALYVLTFSGVATLVRAGANTRVTVGAAVALVATAVAVSGVPSTFDVMRRGEPLRADAPRVNAASPLFTALRALPRAAYVFATQPEAVYDGAHRASLMVPLRRLPELDERNPRYREEVCAMADVLLPDRGVVALFPTLDRDIPDEADLDQLISLQPLGRYPDGALFRVARGCTRG